MVTSVERAGHEYKRKARANAGLEQEPDPTDVRRDFLPAAE